MSHYINNRNAHLFLRCTRFLKKGLLAASTALWQGNSRVPKELKPYSEWPELELLLDEPLPLVNTNIASAKSPVSNKYRRSWNSYHDIDTKYNLFKPFGNTCSRGLGAPPNSSANRARRGLSCWCGANSPVYSNLSRAPNRAASTPGVRNSRPIRAPCPGNRPKTCSTFQKN
jgi:hypothetical protein